MKHIWEEAGLGKPIKIIEWVKITRAVLESTTSRMVGTSFSNARKDLSASFGVGDAILMIGIDLAAQVPWLRIGVAQKHQSRARGFIIYFIFVDAEASQK